MTDESLAVDAETAHDLSAASSLDTALADILLSEPSDESSLLFTAPVLDRLRACD